MKNKFEKLINVWSSVPNEAPYIAVADQEVIDMSKIQTNESQGKLNFKFNYLPQPWWGNIKNPRVIVLLLNPGICKDEDIVEEKYKNSIRENLKGEKTLNWMTDEKSDSHKWWKSTFNKITESEMLPQVIYEKVGVFELIGYHSKKFASNHYSSIKEMLVEELGLTEDFLPTQRAMFDYLDALIKEVKPLVVIIWGQKFWIQEVEILKSLDYIDTISTASHSLSRGNLREIDFERIRTVLK